MHKIKLYKLFAFLSKPFIKIRNNLQDGTYRLIGRWGNVFSLSGTLFVYCILYDYVFELLFLWLSCYPFFSSHYIISNSKPHVSILIFLFYFIHFSCSVLHCWTSIQCIFHLCVHYNSGFIWSLTRNMSSVLSSLSFVSCMAMYCSDEMSFNLISSAYFFKLVPNVSCGVWW